ncbi:MAG: carboxymuconolactone decarboxylase family protein [Planctomycetota bacterium]|nr:carboxymuconolactone decarboxylase family protein [Planctomycetota bacterium]
MLHDATDFYAQWPATMNATKARNADLGKAFGGFFQTLMKDNAAEGGLSVKVKELIALGISVHTRCHPCIYAHVEKCLKVGATPKEIMEATGVAVMMGGGPVYTTSPVVAAALDHFDKHPVGAAH